MGESEKKSVNQKLRRARMRKFLTVEDAARLAEVSTTTYTRWEQGHQKPHLPSLGRLCKAFGRTAAQLGFGDIVDDEEMPTARPPVYDRTPDITTPRAPRSLGALRVELVKLLGIVEIDTHSLERLSIDDEAGTIRAFLALDRAPSKSAIDHVVMRFKEKTGYLLTIAWHPRKVTGEGSI
jgi:transcriptional regulator with XRE-family HTH domain